MLLFQDLNLSTERLTSNKAFTNKLWNAGKFILQNLPSQTDAQSWEVMLAYKVCNSDICGSDSGLHNLGQLEIIYTYQNVSDNSKPFTV